MRSESEEDVEAQAYAVEAIIGRRTHEIRGGKISYEYHVKWEGYTDEHNTWEPKLNINTKMVDEYDASIATVEAIVGRRARDTHGGKLSYEYNIKWQGWAAKDNTWEPRHHIDTKMVDAYEASLEVD